MRLIWVEASARNVWLSKGKAKAGLPEHWLPTDMPAPLFSSLVERKMSPGLIFPMWWLLLPRASQTACRSSPFKLNELAADGVLKEICHGKKEQ